MTWRLRRIWRQQSTMKLSCSCSTDRVSQQRSWNSDHLLVASSRYLTQVSCGVSGEQLSCTEIFCGAVTGGPPGSGKGLCPRADPPQASCRTRRRLIRSEWRNERKGKQVSRAPEVNICELVPAGHNHIALVAILYVERKDYYERSDRRRDNLIARLPAILPTPSLLYLLPPVALFIRRRL